VRITCRGVVPEARMSPLDGLSRLIAFTTLTSDGPATSLWTAPRSA
jgi:hypothetical protein